MSWPTVERSRSRIAAEQNSVSLGAGERLRICLCYPNTYFVGMSNLGYQTLYYLLNGLPGVRCERAFMPEPEARFAPPLCSLESETPLGNFDVLAFSLSFDLDAVNIPRMLLMAGVPIFTRERAGRPLVIAGGIVPMFNPEPLAELVEAFVIGEAEEILPALIEALVEAVGGNATTEESLKRLAHLPGVYVPSLYEAKYNDDGTLAAFAPKAGAPEKITRLCVKQLEDYPCHSRVLTQETEFGGLFLVEVSRGCGRGCKFCVTGHTYRPLRHRAADQVIAAALAGLEFRPTIGLIGAAVSDHPDIEKICQEIMRAGGQISPASVRADSLTPMLLNALAASGARTLTIAPEAGSERLRSSLRKGLTDDQILSGLSAAVKAGLKRLRLYFMLGLPGETEEDIQAIATLIKNARRQGAAHIAASICAFVPKPQTPFEREAMASVKVIRQRMSLLKRLLAGERNIKLEFESPSISLIQAVISRGDRRLGRVLARLAEAFMRDLEQSPQSAEIWPEARLGAWRQALAAEGLLADGYAGRVRSPQELLPWRFID
jgi:radical SAM superfamily enzyme YgiQ (UPF0313 family)